MDVDRPDSNGMCRQWIRDWDGWRYGVLSSASADLLVAWHTTRTNLPGGQWAEEDGRFGTAVQRIRRSRLHEDIQQLEQACRDLLARADDGRPTALKPAFDDLREKLTWLSSSNGGVCGTDSSCPTPQVCQAP